MNKDKLRDILGIAGEVESIVYEYSGKLINGLIDQILSLHQEEMKSLLESVPLKENWTVYEALQDSGGTINPIEADIAEEQGYNLAIKKLKDWQSQKLKELGGEE